MRKLHTVPGVSGFGRVHATTDRTLLIHGTAEPGALVTLYRTDPFKGELRIGTAEADAEGHWTFDHTATQLAIANYRFWAVATDGAGQTGRSPPHEMTLPARAFVEPLAAAVAEERQVFALDIRDLRQAIALNEALLIRPEETIPNTTHYLLLQSAQARMKLARSTGDLEDTAEKRAAQP